MFFASMMLALPFLAAAQGGEMGSVLTNEQAMRVAKQLKQHNTMMEYCGCCEKPVATCVRIGKVTSDSISVTVTGTDLATGKAYERKVDVAEIWLPVLKSGRIEKLECLGLLASVTCDPCTHPSLPTGQVAAKMLAAELDGFMEGSVAVNKGDAKDKISKRDAPGFKIDLKDAAAKPVTDKKTLPLKDEKKTLKRIDNFEKTKTVDLKKRQ